MRKITQMDNKECEEKAMVVVIGLAAGMIFLWASICITFHKGEKEGICNYDHVATDEKDKNNEQQ